MINLSVVLSIRIKVKSISLSLWYDLKGKEPNENIWIFISGSSWNDLSIMFFIMEYFSSLYSSSSLFGPEYDNIYSVKTFSISE